MTARAANAKAQQSSGPVRRVSSGFVRTVAVALLLAIAMVACGGSTESGPVSLDVVSFQTTYPEALPVAQTWRSDAFLTSFSTDVAVRTGEKPPHDFVFRSSVSPLIQLYVHRDADTGQYRDEWLTAAYDPPALVEKIEDIEGVIDSVQALEIVQQNGGEQFVGSGLGDAFYGYLMLENRLVNNESRPVWVAAYYDPGHQRDLHIVIDAASGEVIEVRLQDSSVAWGNNARAVAPTH